MELPLSLQTVHNNHLWTTGELRTYQTDIGQKLSMTNTRAANKYKRRPATAALGDEPTEHRSELGTSRV